MTVRVAVALNGVRVPLELDDEALHLIAAATGDHRDEPWPEWMNIETVARYLDASPERIRKLVSRRQIPFAQDGPRCRLAFNRAAIDEWMERRHHPARPGERK